MTLTPNHALRSQSAYTVPKRRTPTDILLAGNEGVRPPAHLTQVLADLDPEVLRRYPSAAAVEGALASRFGLGASRVLVTAGADDALDRCCRAMLSPERRLLISAPTFEMIPRYASIMGAPVTHVPWDDGAFPLDEMLASITPDVRLIALVTPNNPTGLVFGQSALDAIALAAPDALVLVDHAYVEFADPEFDLTERALEYDHCVVVRTLSKAWGMAGLRVGYAMGRSEVIGWLRAAGNPYAVSGPSAAIARARLAHDADVTAFVEQAKRAREQIDSALRALDWQVTESQANFVFARGKDSVLTRDVFAALGIAIRAWPGKTGLRDAIRISCPGDEASTARVLEAAQCTRPEALLFDMDGVLVDVSKSYRGAILATARELGAPGASADDIRALKDAGDANNDWVVTQRLLAMHGVDVPLDEVTAAFERFYQGTPHTPGLWELEEQLVTAEQLLRLANRGARLGIVTGRPRADAHRFLEHAQMTNLFEVVVCMEDASAKPAPDPVLLAMERLGAQSAWMFGDTVDDVRAARAASARGSCVAPFGVVAPGDDVGHATEVLERAGAGRVLESITEVLEMLP
ncbi:MAG: TIGR01548 family HAD-type hydrolase [Myxococcota bacterium]